MPDIAESYSDVVERLTARITALIPAHPEILAMETSWPLIDVPEFVCVCADLGPTLFQVTHTP